MAVAWPETVNTNAYGMEMVPTENVNRIEFESGKFRTFLKNSVAKKQFAFLLSMDDSGLYSEYKTFLDWFDNTLLSGALDFEFPDLITHIGITEYRMLSDPSVSGQKRKEVSFSVVEA